MQNDYFVYDDIFTMNEKSYFEEFCKNSYFKIKKNSDSETPRLISEFSLPDILNLKILEIGSEKCDELKMINENYELKNFSVLLSTGIDIYKKINSKTYKKGWNIFYNIDTELKIENGGDIIILDEKQDKIKYFSESISGRLLIVDNKYSYIIRPPLVNCNKFKMTILMEYEKNES